MIVKPFSKILNPDEIFAIQNRQYSERLIMTATVPADGTFPAKVSVSNLGHFFCMFITGTFTTLYNDGGVTDTGVSYLSGQMYDGAGMKKLFNERIPLDLWLSPGRRKDQLAHSGAAASNNLFYPIEFEYLFGANTSIVLDCENASNYANQLEICFHGIRIISDMVVRNKVVAGGGLRRAKQQPPRRG